MNLQDEKRTALEGTGCSDHSERYNLSKERMGEIENTVKSMSLGAERKVVDKGGIKTRKLTKKEMKDVWTKFKKECGADFENYMGYGIKDIERIGIKKFFNFVDWVGNDYLTKWKTDMIKTIPCVHCKSEFTTFQLDLGLCDKCKKEYDLDAFNEVLLQSESAEPGSSSGLTTMFAYIEDFRNMYKKGVTVEKMKDCAIIDGCSGYFTLNTLKNYIVGDDKLEESFVHVVGKCYEKDKSLPGIEKFKTISRILTTSNDIENKKNRLDKLFNL